MDLYFKRYSINEILTHVFLILILSQSYNQLRLCSFGRNDFRERDRKILERFDDEICVVCFKRFKSDFEVD